MFTLVPMPRHQAVMVVHFYDAEDHWRRWKFELKQHPRSAPEIREWGKEPGCSRTPALQLLPSTFIRTRASSKSKHRNREIVWVIEYYIVFAIY